LILATYSSKLKFSLIQLNIDIYSAGFPKEYDTSDTLIILVRIMKIIKRPSQPALNSI
jgi:hypothetical protein